jgi:hypothetical protein
MVEGEGSGVKWWRIQVGEGFEQGCGRAFEVPNVEIAWEKQKVGSNVMRAGGK